MNFDHLNHNWSLIDIDDFKKKVKFNLRLIDLLIFYNCNSCGVYKRLLRSHYENGIVSDLISEEVFIIKDSMFIYENYENMTCNEVKIKKLLE